MPCIGPADAERIERFLSEAPIFYQPWWLEAVSPGNWEYAVVRDGSDIAGVMPFVIRTGPMRQITLGMPSLTQTLGPWLWPPATTRSLQVTDQEDLLTQLIEALPVHNAFRQRFHYSLTNWLPFLWKGFRQTTRYTYVLDDLSDLDAVWDGFKENVRRAIRKAQAQVRVVENLGFDRFLEMNELTFVRQGLKPPYPRDFLRRIDQACEARGARKMLFALDEKDRVHAAVYVIWTTPAAYYLMGGADPGLRSSEAGTLLLWEAMRYARGVARTFDFEGSMFEPIEHFVREFGARQMPYFSVFKDTRRMLVKVYSGLRSLVGRSRRVLGLRG